jgi:hypothetical protein
MRAALIGLGLVMALPAAAEGPVPTAYHGLWARDAADCTRGEDLLTLISSRGLGEEGAGDDALAAAGPDAQDGALRLTMRGRDGAAIVTYVLRLRLSADGATLDFALPPPAAPLRLHRCAKHAEAG